MVPAALVLITALPFPLAEGLGAPKYRQREAAHRALRDFGRLALPALEAGTGHCCPEVRGRCEALLWPYRGEMADRDSRVIMPTRWPRLPWIEVYDGSQTRYIIDARRLSPVNGAPDWAEYRLATRLWIRSQLMARVPIAAIRRELDMMAGEERNWIVQHGHNYSPPLKLPEGWK